MTIILGILLFIIASNPSWNWISRGMFYAAAAGLISGGQYYIERAKERKWEN